MSVFLTPDLMPIMGGTYFPPMDSLGRPGFATVLKTISEQVSACAAQRKCTSTHNQCL